MTREYTKKLLEMGDEGLIDWKALAQDALGWMSEAEVEEFARANDYILDEENEDWEEWEEDDEV